MAGFTSGRRDLPLPPLSETPDHTEISPVSHIYNIYKVWGEIKWDF